MKYNGILFSIILLASFLTGSLASNRISFVCQANTCSYLLQFVLLLFVFIVSIDVGSKLDISRLNEIFTKTWSLVSSTIVGSLIAGVVFSLLFSYSIKLSLAISLGMGWYSFDAPTVEAYSGSMAGSLAFFANFFREFLTIALYPVASKLIGKTRPIIFGGATTMDTSLTVIKTIGDTDTIAVAFMHGAFLTLIVPLLVPALLSI
ncbi:MAG: lysine exporter LysO family protein [Conexivisphaerales archaeon]